ncbi:MAG: PEP/pyruvate-binding domain-containing protein, partial [Bryobacteraceae bacterium]
MATAALPLIEGERVERDENKRAGELVLWFEEAGIEDIPLVGGKNASLGEMIRHLASEGVRVPGGFATTAYAYREFIRSGNLGQ